MTELNDGRDRRERPTLGRRAFVGSSIVAGGAALGIPLLAACAGSTDDVGGTQTPASESGAVKEPAVIGYPNDKGVTIERITYTARNMGTPIIGNLFKPANFDASGNYPAIVVTHPFGGVKEQTAGLYAQHLAEQGFVTLAYDASYQGESGGEPRLMEVPAQRVDDISCGIDFLAQQPFVDANRIGSLGICAGGGYAMANAPTEMRARAIATVSMFNLGEARREAMGNLSYEQRMERLKQAADARSREALGEEATLVPVVPESPAEFTDTTPDLYRQGYEYYVTDRAKHPNSPNRYLLSSYQERFAAAVPDEVIGKSIDDLKVDKLAGASGCADGFNDALTKIREQASTNQ